MNQRKKRKFIIVLGGSIVFPEKINTSFLRKFYLFIKKEIKKGNKFIIVCGGGKITRKYQKAASKITKVLDEDKDWLGIHATRLNAHFLRTLFRKESDEVVFDNRFKVKGFGRDSIIIGSGWEPGWSTDFVAIQIAEDFKIDHVIILGKPAYVYTADFEKDRKARPIKRLIWKDYCQLIPSDWKPGLNTPVDPMAARLAERKNIKVIVADGKDLNNLGKILKGEKFKGTILSQ